MVQFSVFVLILYYIGDIFGTEQTDKKDSKVHNINPVMGAVIELTPEGTHQHDTIWHGYHETQKWLNSLREYDLDMECYDYFIDKLIPEYVYRTKVTTVLEWFEIENFAVTSCEMDSLPVQVVSANADSSGYEYVLVFKDSNDKCYQRKYVIETTDLTGSLERYDVEEVTCIHELNSGENEDDVLIIGWSDGGTYDRTYSYLDRPLRKAEYALSGACQTVTVKCVEHHVLPWDYEEYVLVADILINNVRLDRIRVTSCAQFLLETSLTCNSCKCNGNECSTKIRFMKPNRSCVERKYTTVTQFGDHNNVEYIKIERGKLEDRMCK